MLLDAQLDHGLIGAAEAARAAEQVGFAGVWAAEVIADPALAIAAATTTTSRSRSAPTWSSRSPATR